jgi:hypothetical protein
MLKVTLLGEESQVVRNDSPMVEKVAIAADHRLRRGTTEGGEILLAELKVLFAKIRLGDDCGRGPHEALW